MRGPKPKTSPVLAALAALATAGAAMLAGVTTTGMVARVAVAAAGFWALGLVLDRIVAWAVAPGELSGRPGATAVQTAAGTGTQDGKGQHVDVRLPAIAPGNKG